MFGFQCLREQKDMPVKPVRPGNWKRGYKVHDSGPVVDEQLTDTTLC